MCKPYNGMLVSFIRGPIQVKGIVTNTWQPTMYEDSGGRFFYCVHPYSTHNAILGWPSLNKIGAIVSISCLLMKLPTSQGIGQV